MSTISGLNAVVNTAVNGADDFQPPANNMGVGVFHNSLQSCVFSLDWWRCTVWLSFADLAPFLALLGVNDGLVQLGHGGSGFRVIWSGLNGFQVYCEPTNNAAVYCSVLIPSKAMQTIGLQTLCTACVWLCENEVKWRVSRCDPALDTQKFSVDMFADAFLEGVATTRASEWDEHKNSKGGHTFYVGSRESTAFLRVYHKTDGHSFGDEAFTRVELELKSVRADMFFRALLAADMSEWAAIATEHLNGFIQLPLSWWSEFLLTAKSAWLRLRRNIPTIEKAKNWIEKQVVPSLALVVGAVSGGDLDKMQEIFMGWLGDGRRRFNDRHEIMLEQYQADVSPHFAVFSFG